MSIHAPGAASAAMKYLGKRFTVLFEDIGRCSALSLEAKKICNFATIAASLIQVHPLDAEAFSFPTFHIFTSIFKHSKVDPKIALEAMQTAVLEAYFSGAQDAVARQKKSNVQDLSSASMYYETDIDSRAHYDIVNILRHGDVMMFHGKT